MSTPCAEAAIPNNALSSVTKGRLHHVQGVSSHGTHGCTMQGQRGTTWYTQHVPARSTMLILDATVCLVARCTAVRTIRHTLWLRDDRAFISDAATARWASAVLSSSNTCGPHARTRHTSHPCIRHMSHPRTRHISHPRTRHTHTHVTHSLHEHVPPAIATAE